MVGDRPAAAPGRAQARSLSRVRLSPRVLVSCGARSLEGGDLTLDARLLPRVARVNALRGRFSALKPLAFALGATEEARRRRY
jgi:hypothetical protein